jgi:ketosteroid isomerase-like protein
MESGSVPRDTAPAVPGEYVEILRSAYAALNAGDIDAALRFASDDLVIHLAGPNRVVQGKAAVKAFTTPDAFSEQTFEPLEIRENGDVVFAWLLVRAKGAGSGLTLEEEAAHVWEFRDRKAVSLTVTFDRRAALDAAGLPE